MSASSASPQDERIPDACPECEQSDEGSCPRHPTPKLSGREADAYIATQRPRYHAKTTTRREKTAILDDIGRVTVYHRDTVKRKMADRKPQRPPRKRGRKKKYTDQDASALLYLREVARYIDARGFKSQIPNLIEKVDDAGHYFFSRETKRHLVEMSPRTIDRIVTEYGAPRPHSRAARRGKRRRGSYEASLRVRTWAEWNNEPPGSVLADHVHHTGNEGGGRHCYTITVIDVATSWTWLQATDRLDKELVAEMLGLALEAWPVPIHALHTDRGTEFLNHAVGSWANGNGINHTMGRIGRSNDQARVEQRNFTAVRLELAGYRFAGERARDALNAFYERYCLYLNYLRPVRKKSWRGPHGEKPSTRFRDPATPCELMLASGELDAEAQELLQETYDALDPVLLNTEIERALKRVMRYAS